MSDFLNFKNQITSVLKDKVATKLSDLELRLADEMFNEGFSYQTPITVEEGLERVERIASMLSEAAPNEAVIRALKPAFASEYAFYSKAHSFHWNVEGKQFSEFHNLFGKIYEEVYGSIDDFAENIRKAGGYAPTSLEEISEMAYIDSKGMVEDPFSMVSELLNDSETLSDMFGVVYKIAEAAGAYGLANFLADRQDAHDKHSWMLRSTLKAAGYDIEEETEELDELKASTLGSYIGKASKDLEKGTIIGTKIHALTTGMHRNSHQWMRDDANHYKRSGKRVAGIKAATDKLVKGQVTKEEYDLEEGKLMGPEPTNKEKESSKVQVPVSKEAQQKSPSVTKPEAAGPGPKFGDADFDPEKDKMKVAPKFSSDEKDSGASNLVTASAKVLSRITQAEQQKKPSISTPETEGPGPKFGDADVVAGPTNKPAPSFSSDKEDEGAANRVATSSKIQKKISKEEQQTKPSISTPENNPGLPSFSDVNFREETELEESRFKKGQDVGKPGKNFAKIAKSAAARYGLNKEEVEEIEEDGLPGHDQAKAPVSAPVIMDSKKIKKEAVEDLKGQNGTKTPSWKDMIKQSLLTLDKDGNAVMKAKATDAGSEYTKNPDDEILAKVGLKKK